MRMLKPRLTAIDARTVRPPPKEREEHYGTARHRDWSRQVIERSGGVCQAIECGRMGVRLFADHIVELKDGGAPFDVRNGQALCGSCHGKKTSRAKMERERE